MAVSWIHQTLPRRKGVELTDCNVACFINVYVWFVTRRSFHRLRFSDGADAKTFRLRLRLRLGGRILASGYHPV